jgi:ATP-binding cassette subfamily B protein
VPQDTVLFNDTIGYNIAYGRHTATEAEVIDAAKAARIHDFVTGLPDGYDTQVGERGLKLSGGEKQRVGIARALYKKSEILVFDEVTSALDPVTERAIVQSINHLASLGKTILIVAHRITTLEKCDRILELVDGKLAGERGYDELIKELVLHE